MILELIPVGQLQANCYIFGDKEDKQAVVIDPGDEGEKIFKLIKEKDYNIKYIIATHGHVDHISAIKYLKDKTNAKVIIHKNDADALINPQKNLSVFLGYDSIQGAANIEVTGGEDLVIGKYKFKIIHTPGHTPGGICILLNKILFSGDTIFQRSIGRTDLPGGNHKELIKSIKEKIFTLEEDIIVYPGHGPKTSILEEKQHNPYF